MIEAKDLKKGDLINDPFYGVVEVQEVDQSDDVLVLYSFPGLSKDRTVIRSLEPWWKMRTDF